MNNFRRLIDGYVKHYNKAFWLIFAAAGSSYIASVSLGIQGLDLALGLIITAAGIHRLGAELAYRRLRASHQDAVRAVNELLQWAEKSYDYTRAFKERHERRLFRQDQRRGELENKLEEQFRSAVKKIIDLENKLNSLMRGLGAAKPAQPMPPAAPAPASRPARPRPGPKVADISRTQRAAIALAREQGRITNKDYRQRFRVSEKKAYNDLSEMEGMGLLKRRGQGRSTHYVLAF
jgi:hypothetical protein